jgi:hypothetical protein
MFARAHAAFQLSCKRQPATTDWNTNLPNVTLNDQLEGSVYACRTACPTSWLWTLPATDKVRDA